MNNVADDLYKAYSDGFVDGYKQGMKDAQPEPQWIPCSERFPDKDGDYIVTGNKTRKIWIAKYSTGSCFGVEISAWINDSKNPVIKAWMPLPELYSERKK